MEAAFFELSFTPDVRLVTVIRRFVTEFYQRFLDNPDATSRVALATHELLENAMKYSKDGHTTIRIEVRGTTEKTVHLMLRNRAHAKDIVAIREVLDGVASASDAADFYYQLIARKAREKSASGLGLARICAEGEMKITYRVEDVDLATLEATTVVGVAA